MYEKYTHQSLPSKQYRELLGSAICVFNANNAFVIETILRLDIQKIYDWFHLTDLESGRLKPSIQNVISTKCGPDIEKLFEEIIDRRNRIVHSFQITNKNGDQVLATKEKVSAVNRQFEITEEYLLEFIELNDQLSGMLHDLRATKTNI